MKVALIGCGTIAKTHLDVLKHLGHSVTALCDRNEDKAKKTLPRIRVKLRRLHRL